jgi:hypothetical protein
MADYEVGYKKPLEGSRYPKGVSGNPKGRPKGRSQDIASVVNEAALTPVGVKHKGKKTKMELRKALILNVLMEGLTGDAKARKLALETLVKFDSSPCPASIAELTSGQSPFELTAEDEANIAKHNLLKGVK